MTPDVPVEQARSDRHAAGIETAAREFSTSALAFSESWTDAR